MQSLEIPYVQEEQMWHTGGDTKNLHRKQADLSLGTCRKSEKAGQVRGRAGRQDPKGTGLSESTPLYGVTLDPKLQSQQPGASFMTLALRLAERSQSQVPLFCLLS